MSNDYADWLAIYHACPQLEKLEPNPEAIDKLTEEMVNGMDSTMGEPN